MTTKTGKRDRPCKALFRKQERRWVVQLFVGEWARKRCTRRDFLPRIMKERARSDRCGPSVQIQWVYYDVHRSIFASRICKRQLHPRFLENQACSLVFTHANFSPCPKYNEEIGGGIDSLGAFWVLIILDAFDCSIPLNCRFDACLSVRLKKSDICESRDRTYEPSFCPATLERMILLKFVRWAASLTSGSIATPSALLDT